jgi:hypothetical protein
MYATKFKTAAALALMWAAASVVGVPYLKAAAPAKVPAKPENKRLKELLQQRRERAEKELKIRYELYRAGANEPGTGIPVTLTTLLAASKRLLKAEVELSAKKPDRLAAHERHVKLLKEFVKITEAQYKVGRLSEAALTQAQYEQLDAEIDLEREKER